MSEIATQIRLTNSLTRRKEVLQPVVPGRVGMYVCGPTVYDRAHLGNARPVIVFDVLYRLLRHVYGPDAVTYVRNITDVDDKIIDRARDSGVQIDDLTRQTGDWFAEDMAALGALPPTHEPRATQHIAHMVAMIGELMDKRAPDGAPFAYQAQGHVLFRVAADPDYGILSGRSVDDMIAGARVEVAPYKRDPMDFVLWKPSTPDQPGWDSPWGRGRPGWHIECSAMARDLLGPAFDIHGGGSDLMFPHHENEIAQSHCAGDPFATIWLHNEMLQVEGKKMSKSLGNFFTVRDLLDQGWPGEVIRLVFLGTHYRSPMDWTVEKGVGAQVALERYLNLINQVGDLEAARGLEPDAQIVAALSDDLNTHLAVNKLAHLAREADGTALAANLVFLGIYSPDVLAERVQALRAGPPPETAQLIETLLAERLAARKARDFARADALRDGIVAAGIVIMDRPDGPTEWKPGPDFDPTKLEALR